MGPKARNGATSKQSWSRRLSKHLLKFERGNKGKRRRAPGWQRKGLPAATYYTIMGAIAQHRQALHQLHLDQCLQQLTEELQTDPLKSVAGDRPEQPHRHSTPLTRLSNLCSMMQHRVAPYHLAMGPHEVVLAALQSLPWLWRTRSQLEQFERTELGVLMHQWVEHQQLSYTLQGRARGVAVAAMSRSARRQLLRSFSRYILAADDSQHLGSSSSSPAEQRSTWEGISYALFPDGISRELKSLTDRWRSRPDANGMSKQQQGASQQQQQQLRAGSITARYLSEVRAYSTSPYPSFDDILREELHSSISTHTMHRVMAARVGSSPSAGAEGSATHKQQQQQLQAG